jgi:nuclear receptor interaction protein
VRKFAPNGQPQMKVKDKGHVTACKISDAYPNELIVSWSEDSIYSFDIIRDPEQGDKASSVRSSSNRVKESELRKRKRPRSGSNESQDDVQQTADRLREESTPLQEFLRVRYGNGQQEDIPIGSDGSDDTDGGGRSARAHAIATNLVKIRDEIFKAVRLTSPVDWKILDEPDFALILHTAADIIPVIDETVASWPYSDDSAHLRRGQQAACRRFIQAAGLLARVLGGKPPMYGEDEQEKREKWASTMWRHFDYIGCVSATEDSPILVQNESIQIPPRAQFYYDFLKAICLWLDSGVGTMLNRFSSLSGRGKRFPIKSNPSVAAFDSVLIPYLERLASAKPITSVDVSRFEHDENRILFATEEEAVVAFGKALETPFTDLSRDGTGQSENSHSQDREEARLFWAYTVGRAVLMNAAKMEHELPFLNHTFAYNAFGGISRPSAEIRAAEREFLSRHEDVGTPSAVSDDDEDEYGSDAGSYEEYEEESSEDDYEGYESFSGHANWGQAFERRKIRERAAINVQCSLQTRTYSGHCNKETVKDVNFFGRDDEYIVSGSDCGNLFIWDKKTSEIVNILQGDSEVVNVATGWAPSYWFSKAPSGGVESSIIP